MFDRRIEESGLLDTLTELGTGAIAFSPLDQGLLTDRYLKGIPSDSRAATGRWMTESNITQEYLDRAKALNEIALSRGQTLAQLAIQWVLRDPAVTSALIGASSVRQLEDSLRALDGPALTEDELARLARLASKPA